MKPLSLFTGVLLACSSHVLAQPTMAFYGAGVLPQREIKNEGYKNGGDFRISFLSGNLAPHVKNETPFFSLHVGGSVDFHWGETKSYDALVSPVDTSEALPGKLRLSTSTVGLSAIARGYFGRGRLQPYAQVFIGPRWFNSDQTLSVDPIDNSDRTFEDSHDNIQSSLSWHFGYGAGVRYMFNRVVGIDAGFDYSYGTKAQYLIPSKTTFEANNLEVSTGLRNTRTNLLFINLGIVFKLNPVKASSTRPQPTKVETEDEIDFSDDSLKKTAPIKTKKEVKPQADPTPAPAPKPKEKIELAKPKPKVKD